MWSRAYVSVGHLSICQSQHCSLDGRIYRSTAAALQWSHAASAALSAYVVAKHTHTHTRLTALFPGLPG